MKYEEYAVILMYSTNHALRAESLLKKAGISCKLIPVPRHLSSDCGVCVRIKRGDKEAALRTLETAQVEIEDIHPDAASRKN
jgi:hypothetical protein